MLLFVFGVLTATIYIMSPSHYYHLYPNDDYLAGAKLPLRTLVTYAASALVVLAPLHLFTRR